MPPHQPQQAQSSASAVAPAPPSPACCLSPSPFPPQRDVMPEHQASSFKSNNSSGNASSNSSCVNSDSAFRAARSAARAVSRMSKSSNVLDRTKEDEIPTFQQKELVLGKLLGKGGFSSVYEVSKFELSPDPKIEHDAATRNGSEEANRRRLKHERRTFLSDHCRRDKSGDARYAVKFLSREVMSDPRRFRTGAADLAIEAKFLTSLEHPNIIKMRGVTEGGAAGFATGRIGGYFLVMDRLYDTLETRIQQWKIESRKHRGFRVRRMFGSDKQSLKRREALAHRLNVAFDIAGALSYLHSINVIYRDLKPENVGFDVRGDVKIFDFGLAKEIHAESALENDTYKLSGNTGSLRYMAPEVARSEPYNLSADVYSFATVLWEMISLSKPYKGFDRKMHDEMVVRGDVRPAIDDRWPFPVRSLITRGWSSDLAQRPNMESICKILKKEIGALRNGDETGLEHRTRRSTYVMQRPANSLKEMMPNESGSQRALAA